MPPKAKAAAGKAAAIPKRGNRAVATPVRTRHELSGARARQNVTLTSVGAKPSSSTTPTASTESKSTDADKAQKIIDCFKKFDVDGDGKISRVELTAVFSYLSAPDVDLDGLMSTLDKNGDGVIDYEEFTEWLYDKGEFANKVLDEFVAKAAEMTAAKEQLELALLHLYQAERAAEAPQPVDIWFEKDAQIGLHFGKGDEKLSNMVVTAAPADAAYAAGVRETWRVLQVGDHVVKETSYVPDLIMEARRTGGVRVKFMPSDATERHRVADASLAALRAAVDKARAVLEELQRPIVVADGSDTAAKEKEDEEGPPIEPSPEELGVPPPWVKVQYYDYREPFHAPDGCLTASAIDEVYGLSDAMPGCKIILAEWRPGNTHILDFDDVDSGASPFVDEKGGVFQGLEAECLYFLLVQENGEVEKKEIAARRAQKEAERLEDVRRKTPHDCAKEQVYGRIEVSEAWQHPWVNGQYHFCGSKGPRPKYVNTVMQPNTGRSIIEFEGKWRIIASEDDFIPQPSLYTPAGDDPGLLPPSGSWPSCTDLTHARLAVNRKTVCRICDPRAGGSFVHGAGISFLGL